jgi:aldose sugar dehydrogenase
VYILKGTAIIMYFHFNRVIMSTIVLLLGASIFLGSAYSMPNVNNDTTVNNSLSDTTNLSILENKGTYQLNVTDPNLSAELVAAGLRFPTSMAFLGENDILVLGKENGIVSRIVNGQILEKPLIDVNVYGLGENGLLGVATAKNNGVEANNITKVFLFFSESSDTDTKLLKGAAKPLGNRLYRYDLANNTLLNPQLILDLPYSNISSPMHSGGRVIIGPDNNVYVVTGDLGDHYTEAQNVKDGDPADGSSGVLRFQQNGEPVLENEEGGEENVGILGEEYPLNMYYAYGIRNSFGMDFDPITGNLWDTENGPGFGDEINLVEPRFNSGHDIIHGLAEEQDDADVTELVDFDGKGNYSDPEFVWNGTVAPTALRFVNSSLYGDEYENDILVGDFNYGNIYHFGLDEDRQSLTFEGNLTDKTANSPDEMKEMIFAQGAGGIVDIQMGPDGYIYVLSLLANVSDCHPELPGCVADPVLLEGVIHKIIPANN